MAALARENVFLLLEMGVYEATLELLGVEMERGRGVYEGTKTNITIADNLNLRGTNAYTHMTSHAIKALRPLQLPSNY